MKFTKELMEKAKACETVEELTALAKENDVTLSLEEAELFLEDFAEGELTDEELDNVAGGQEGCKKPRPYERQYWEREEDVQFIFKEGDIVEAFALSCDHHTATVKVINKRKELFEPGWVDQYWLEKLPGVKSAFIKGWHCRSRIEKP